MIDFCSILSYLIKTVLMKYVISILGNLTILMVVGGFSYPQNVDYDVELIDLSGQERTCRKPDDYPGAEKGSIGAYVQDRALVCGGYFYDGAPNYNSECYYYNTNGTWTQGPSMTEARSVAGSSFFNGLWWISGGSTSFEESLSSTELFDSSSNSFIPFVDLPEESWGHSILSIDDNVAMFLGSRTSRTYFFNGSSWIDGPLNLWSSRHRCQAGLVTFNNGTRMAVAAGGFPPPANTLESTEFLPLGDAQWHFGPDLPNYIYDGESVQLENTFLMVGGENGTGYHDTIWKFDVESEEWALLNEHLITARTDLNSAFLVPDHFC